MKCNNCGFEHTNDSLFCTQCGKSLTQPQETECTNETQVQETPIASNKHSKKKTAILCGIPIGIALAAVVLFLVLMNRDYPKQIMECIEAGEIVKAQELYDKKVRENEKHNEELHGLIVAKGKEIVNSYVNETIVFDEALGQLESLYQVHIIDKATEEKNLTYISNLKGSRDSFLNGKKLLESEPQEAITCFREVIKEDSNYEDAQDLKKQAQQNYEQQTIATIKQYGDEKEYEKALELIDRSYISFDDTAPLRELECTYKNTITTKVLKKADKLSKKQKYDEAISYLTSNQSFDINDKITDKLEHLQKEKKETAKQKLKKIKPRIRVDYDEIDNDYSIVPRGYSSKYNNLNFNTNIELRIYMTPSPSLGMMLGFDAYDWVFMEDVKFMCDDMRENIHLDYFKRGSDVIGGGEIAEWYFIWHNKLFSQTSTSRDLEPLITHIINSSTTKIRFSGKGIHNHTVSKREKQTIKDIWETYTILEEYPDLLDIIK